MSVSLNRSLFVFICSSLGIVLHSCNPAPKPVSAIVAPPTRDSFPELMPDSLQPTSTGKLYEFFLTTDPAYCAQDSIVEGDCNSGYLYLTDKGNIFFQYLCVNDASLDYDLGHIIDSGDKMTCVFDQSYSVSYPEGDSYSSEPLTDRQLNNASIRKEKKHLIQLQALSCRLGAYGFKFEDPETDAADYYFVLPADAASLNHYRLDFQRIKAFHSL
jgi:hypothetical protein